MFSEKGYINLNIQNNASNNIKIFIIIKCKKQRTSLLRLKMLFK